MSNLFTTVASLAKALNQSTISKLNRSIDTFVEQFNDTGEYKPVSFNACFLPHSKSPRYPNGNYQKDTVEEIRLTEEDKQKALEFAELHNTYSQESVIILNHLKSLGMKIPLLTTCEDMQAHQLLFDILPDFILNDKALLLRCGLSEEEVENLQNRKYPYNSVFMTDAEKAEFIGEVSDSNAHDLMEKYYALDLLTNF